MGGDHLGLKHAAGLRTDRKERAVGGAALLAEGGQHDVHDLVVMRQNRTQTVIEPARGVTVGRADEFIIEAEAVEEGLQAGIVVRTEGRVRSERVAHRRQRQAEIGLHRLAVGNVVGHLAKTVHIIRETDKPRLRAGHHLESMAHHRCAHHLAEGADMRQAGRAIAGLEQNLAVMVRGFQPFDQVAGLGKGPSLGVAGGVPDGGDAVGHDDRVLSSGPVWQFGPEPHFWIAPEWRHLCRKSRSQARSLAFASSRRDQSATGPAAGPGNMKSALEAPPD